MNDKTTRTFTCDQDKKRYRWIGDNGVATFTGSEVIRSIESLSIQLIIEPTLEDDDWCMKVESFDEMVCLYRGMMTRPKIENLKEVRKANGEHWKKTNGEWKKVMTQLERDLTHTKDMGR